MGKDAIIEAAEYAIRARKREKRRISAMEQSTKSPYQCPIHDTFLKIRELGGGKTGQYCEKCEQEQLERFKKLAGQPKIDSKPSFLSTYPIEKRIEGTFRENSPTGGSMELTEKIRIARYAINHCMDYETLYYCDELYGHEKDADEIWPLVKEHNDIGRIAFDEKYGK